MKPPLLYVLTLISGCGLSGLLGFRVGFGRGLESGNSSSFVAALDSLEKLREGTIPEATRRLELHCFANAVGLLSSSGWRAQSVTGMMMPSLARYRKSYRTNQTEWTPTEVRLEEMLENGPLGIRRTKARHTNRRWLIRVRTRGFPRG